MEEFDDCVYVGGYQIGDEEDLSFWNQGVGEIWRLVYEIEDVGLGLFYDVIRFVQFVEVINLQGVFRVVFDVFFEFICEYILYVVFIFFVCVMLVGGVDGVDCGYGCKSEC